MLRFISNVPVPVWEKNSQSGTPETSDFARVYLGRGSKLPTRLDSEPMALILALELSVVCLPFLCRFAEELRTRSAGKGGSHRRHDRAPLPPAGGSPCCRGEGTLGTACPRSGAESCALLRVKEKGLCLAFLPSGPKW